MSRSKRINYKELHATGNIVSVEEAAAQFNNLSLQHLPSKMSQIEPGDEIELTVACQEVYDIIDENSLNVPQADEIKGVVR